MSSPQDTSITDRTSPALHRTSTAEATTSYPHQNLPRRSHSDRSRPRSPPHHYGRDNDLPPLPFPDMSNEARRQSLMAMDRKRRLTASSQDTGRRRTTTGGFTSRDNRFYQTHSRQGSQPSSSSAHTSSVPEVIDLTGSSPPAPARAEASFPQDRVQSTASRGYSVPTWQPDTDVSECPICRRPFTFLFRRHHCRKCGRVVCNECSPHRITIPRQYIVHPPGEEDGQGTNSNTVDLTRDDDEYFNHAISQSRVNQGLGGGEKVRLCNPCVPDPQPELQSVFNQSGARPLPPAPSSHNLTFGSLPASSSFSRYSPQILPSPRQPDNRQQPLPHLPHPGTRISLDSEDDEDDSGSSPETYRSSMGRRLTGNPSQHHSHAQSYSHSRYYSLDANRPPLPPVPFPDRHRMQSMLEASRRYYANLPPNVPGTPNFRAGSGSSSSNVAPRPPRPRIREEDMCPVCRGILPPKGPGDDETDRENHIMQCISQHDNSALLPGLNQRARSNTQTPTQASQSAFANSQAPMSASLPTSPPTRAMPMQMLRFIATEKDCGTKADAGETNDGAQLQECSICMVEYEVGERLARLECWCKFHEECIVEWFTRKRECPVHKLS